MSPARCSTSLGKQTKSRDFGGYSPPDFLVLTSFTLTPGGLKHQKKSATLLSLFLRIIKVNKASSLIAKRSSFVCEEQKKKNFNVEKKPLNMTASTVASVADEPSSFTGAPPCILSSTDPFTSRQHMPKMPWEMSLDERRRTSKDPRIAKQVADEDQWNGTVVQGLWKKFRPYSTPQNDWIISRDAFSEYLRASVGLESEYLVQHLHSIFDPREEKQYNGLVLCKMFQIALTTQPTQDQILSHCFDKFDRPIGSNILSKKMIMGCTLQSRAGVDKKKNKNPSKKKGGASVIPFTMCSGADYDCVEGLKRILRRSEKEMMTTSQQAVDSSPPCGAATRSGTDDDISFDQFKMMCLDPQNGDWVSTFQLALFECAAKYFCPPCGKLPLVALRWLNTITPIPLSDEIYDADIVLLREIEVLGCDPSFVKKDKKKGNKKK